jgi:glycosyltransferase involved in cell wall biosynthesis
MSLIAVDMTPVLPGGENGGAKILTLELLKSFRVLAPEDRFLLLTASWNHDELAVLDGKNMSRLCVLKGQEPKPKSLGTMYPGRLQRALRSAYRYLKRNFQISKLGRPLLSLRGVDLLFCPFTAPTYSEPGIPTVSIILDLQHRDNPQFFSPYEVGLRDAYMTNVVRQADRIICISEYVRDRLLTHMGAAQKRIYAVPVCVHSRLTKPVNEKGESELDGLGIQRRPYMFYPANFWPHKNHRMLLTAFAMFVSRNPNSMIDLVLTGDLEQLQNELKSAAKQMGLAERVHFLGFLPQERLADVWYGCEFLIFPSLYEGFGIPILEAMSIGKPVLCSNSTSLPEVAGDAALYFDPRRPLDIVKCLERITSDPGLREDMVNRGYSRATDFKTEAMTHRYLEILHSAIGNPLPFSNQLTGIFEDGWIGPEMIATYGPGCSGQKLELRVKAPRWVPVSRLKVKIRDGKRILQKLSIERGKELTIRQPLSAEGGQVTLTVRPTFRPSECGLNEDTRALGLRCYGCSIISPGEEKTSLM